MRAAFKKLSQRTARFAETKAVAVASQSKKRLIQDTT